MTDISVLISKINSFIPFKSTSDADAFLQNYSVDDQAALISALYIGRDHLHVNEIAHDYVPNEMIFDRFFTTGGESGNNWLIEPKEFGKILYEKNTNLSNYYKAFTRCATGSGYNLSDF